MRLFKNDFQTLHEFHLIILYYSFAESIYRRGARRWRKVYKVNGHIFQAKRFNRVTPFPLLASVVATLTCSSQQCSLLYIEYYTDAILFLIAPVVANSLSIHVVSQKPSSQSSQQQTRVLSLACFSKKLSRFHLSNKLVVPFHTMATTCNDLDSGFQLTLHEQPNFLSSHRSSRN